MKKFLILSLLISATAAVSAQELLRGPYLQFPTSSSMKVMWRTDVPTAGRVYYGTSLDNLMDNHVEVTDEVIDHNVNITGLQPQTEYYYAISDGQNVLSGGDAIHRFTTWPVPGTETPVSVWAIGDFGKGNTKQANVMQAFENYAGDDLVDVWLWLGDNAYSDGLDAEYQANVFDSQWGMTNLMKRMPFMATPGNHDYLSIAPPTVSQNPLNNNGAYFDLIDVYRNGEMGGVPSGHELFYSFDYGNVHFININSEIGSVLSGSNDWTGANPFSSFNGSPMTQWIHADLQANDKPWVIAYFHQPAHSEGSHSSGDLWERYMTAMRANICPILEQYGVDIIITGHSHVYERSYLLNGYFGTPGQFNIANHAMDASNGSLEEGTPYIKYRTGANAGKGTVYVVQGNSGSSTTEPDLNHPAMVSVHGCSECVGSHMLYIHGDTLKGKYLTGSGEILDEYAIVKQEGPSGIVDAVNTNVSGLKVFPNPFSSETTVRFEMTKQMNARVELVSINGQVLRVLHTGKLAKGRHQFTVSADGLAKGSYLVRISTDAQPAVARLLKVE
jgi:hypothetical protein